jgi:hypothetical protein
MFQVHVGFVIHLLIMPCEEMTSKAGAVLLEKSSPQALFIISDFALLGIFSSYRFNLSNTCRINTKPKIQFPALLGHPSIVPDGHFIQQSLV